MKTATIVVVFLVLGSLVGWLIGRREFADDYMAIHVQHVRSETADGGGKDENLGQRLKIVNGELYDFVSMDRSATMSHTFRIRNDGDEVLRVTKEGTSCKC